VTGGVNDVIRPIARAEADWTVTREYADGRRNHEALLESFQAEIAVRDVLTRYVSALNRGDVDAMAGLFTDDCVVTSPRGTLVGADAVRADLEAHLRTFPRGFHLWPSVVVRLSAELGEADTTAYFYAMLIPKHGSTRSVGGLVADKVLCRDGEWRIGERSTNVDLAALAAEPGPVEMSPLTAPSPGLDRIVGLSPRTSRGPRSAHG
jgi:uncharacterized protein (TIGR02246 family)